MSVKAIYTANLVVTETGAALDDAPALTATHDGNNTSVSLNATSSPAASATAHFTQALTTGAASIDMTALPQTFGSALDSTGKKVRFFKFKAPAANAGAITLVFGASNPYNLLGASWKVILPAGGEVMGYLLNAAPTVASGAKKIDLAGTGTDSVHVELVLG